MKKGKFSFGGIHPHIEKTTASKPSIRMPNTKNISISLWQHVGKPAIALKNKGDIVLKGELIATAEGIVSSNIHASVSGKVSMIEIAPPPLGRNGEAISIVADVDAQDVEYTDRIDYKTLSAEEILNKIKDSGIVGMGGAMFPTSVKVSGSIDKSIDTIVVNAAECEPYITSDHRMMLEYTSEIVTAIDILRYIIPSVSNVLVGIENNKPDAIELLEKYSIDHSFEVCSLRTMYPQGGEKQLIEATTGRIVPIGKLPFDVGVLVVNVATLFAIYEAVVKNKPLIERLVTVVGDGVAENMNVWVPIGTRVEDIIDFAGGTTCKEVLAIAGGPMMGSALSSFEQTTIKGTNCILVLNRDNYKEPKEYPCINCARCIDVCPMKLMPTSIVKSAKSNNHKKMAMLEINSCIECGCCSYICPSRIKLVSWIRVGKNSIQKSAVV